MNKVSNLKQVTNFVVYITLQVTVARFIEFFHTGFCFVYVGFLLLLPRGQQSLTTLLLISFAVGLLIDMFYNSIGIHSFAAVLMVYSRALLLKLILPTSSYDIAPQPTLARLGWKRFSLLNLLLIGIHHAALFLLDAGNASLFLVAMRNLLFSALLTYVAVLMIQVPTLLFSKR